MMQNTVPKHYLWAVGDGMKVCRPGELIAGRYKVIRDRVVQDTQPELNPEMPENIPGVMTPYLRLFPYRLHVPQVYGMVSRTVSKLSSDLWLLEGGSISSQTESLMPELTSLWKGQGAMRQLNWLWQIAQLWDSMRSLGVCATLLNPSLLRVEGPLIKILELQSDQKKPSLRTLGKVWLQLVPDAHPMLVTFLDTLCQQMIHGEVHKGTVLIAQLDKALALSGRAYKRTINIATATDTGPTRSHNEDACYPPSQKMVSTNPGGQAVAIVCDGIGGQEAGEVASQLAINTLREQVEKMILHPANWDSTLTGKLEHSTCIANDVIAQLNDQEHRQGRQRMGTTLVMGLAHVHEMYITHIGDSRAYWITRHGCYAVTVDDDVASREVRLGYSLYGYAVQQVAAGALVQALGITSSSTLHPTVQRFPLDEDCIFLLCSDGLSDRDRVEQFWDTEILPLLSGNIDLATVRDRLIQIANTRNGHDNVTVALMYCQVLHKDDANLPTELSIPPVENSTSSLISEHSDTDETFDDFQPTDLIPSHTQNHNIPLLVVKILILLSVASLLAYFFIPPVHHLMDGSRRKKPIPKQTQLPSESITPLSDPASDWKEGDFILIESPLSPPDPGQNRFQLLKELGQESPKGTIPVNSVVLIKEKKYPPEIAKTPWLYVEVCSIPKTVSSNNSKNSDLKSLQVGDRGWIELPEATFELKRNSPLSPSQRGRCLPNPKSGN
jgi:serine/threonine protein phosphatase PrpC